jgi:YD repeat-containing protein
VGRNELSDLDARKAMLITRIDEQSYATRTQQTQTEPYFDSTWGSQKRRQRMAATGNATASRDNHRADAGGTVAVLTSGGTDVCTARENAWRTRIRAYNAEGLREAVWGSYARTGLPEAISSAAYNADDEQTERNGKKLSYDAEGNLTSDGSSEYKWNARGQLAEITGAIKAAFAYDPFGRRVSSDRRRVAAAFAETTKPSNEQAS